MARSLIAFALSILMAGAVASPARAGLINGNFDDPYYIPGTFGFTFYGNASTYDSTDPLPGWTVTKGDVGLYWTALCDLPADNGNQQFLNLNGTTSGGISQVMAAQAGTTYNLSFDFSGFNDTADPTNFNAGSSGNMMYYSLYDGVTNATLGYGEILITNSDDYVWTNVNLSVTATSSLLGVHFENLGGGPSPFQGPCIDNVSLNASAVSVPEPSSACLTLAGVAAAFALRVRGRSRTRSARTSS